MLRCVFNRERMRQHAVERTHSSKKKSFRYQVCRLYQLLIKRYMWRKGATHMISADLGQQLETFVASLVATGRYNSKSEVLREGVRLIQDRETRLAALDASIARGLADADASNTTPAEDVFDRLEAKYRAMGTGS
ncbi:type II toxin-antitoxin system ParD family antitoxin [Sphingobium indicum]|nr:type II toxin-antitoxin system ParD family antitoxin [Sphingobium indicum]